MDTGKYKVIDFLEFQNLDQLIVPEIQRDYVWTEDEVLDLLETINNGFRDINEDIPYLGFFYAYNDKNYVYKYFLVDGQQRMTTVYLLLLACHQKINKKLNEYLYKNDKLKLDYKVRQATHDFLTDFINHCRNNQNGYDFNIKDQVWYHKEYDNDRTICNLIINYNVIRTWLDKFELEIIPDFLKYIENKLELSYFDIENGREGEELYIYMNSRGRQLEPNETLKAKFLAKYIDNENKEKWGKQWEEWQDFFWKNRGINPDADSGFNEFLLRVQIINMCNMDINQDIIRSFVSGRSIQKISIDLLPKSLEEINKYFLAFRFLVESEGVKSFFEKYEKSDFFSTAPEIDRRQIFYLRTLPILTLLTMSNLKDDSTIKRFVRYFYNVARKSNVGKDISGQLISAIKLMIEYSKNVNIGHDVCDLIEYTKHRTVLIDDEEILKLSLYKKPPEKSSRQEIEEIFWSAEDHQIFNGEIIFLISKYYNKESGVFDLSNFKKTWFLFNELFLRNKKYNSLITRALLYYGITWLPNTPYYYHNYDCQDWYSLVRNEKGKYLLELLEDLHGKSADYLDIIIRIKAKQYFIKMKWSSLDSIKSVEPLLDQIRVLAAIDYYSDKILWKRGGYIAEDIRFNSSLYGDTPFFKKDLLIYNTTRYIYDGLQGRILKDMETILKDETKVVEILNNILTFEELSSELMGSATI